MDDSKQFAEFESRLQRRFDLLNQRLDKLDKKFHKMIQDLDDNFDYFDQKNNEVLQKLNVVEEEIPNKVK